MGASNGLLSSNEWQGEGGTRPWGVGGSDVGAILGLSPYRSPVDVWLEKVSPTVAGTQSGHHDQLLDQVGCQGLGAAHATRGLSKSGVSDELHLRFGQHLEPFVAKEYERVTGHTTHEHGSTVHHRAHKHLFAHVDRLVSTDGSPVLKAAGQICTDTLLECKTASAFSASQWGEAWGDQVPTAYLAQCIWYTTLTGCRFAHLAVLIGNSEVRVYRITHDQELGERLVQAALNFWDEHVMTCVPPEPRNRQEVQALYPREVGGRVVGADDDVLRKLRRLHRINELSKRLEQDAEIIKDSLAALMRDSECITHQGVTIATWRTSAPTRRLDQARLKRERPEVYSAYTVESAPTRRLVLGGVGHA